MGWFKSAPLAVSMIGHATLLAGAAFMPARVLATPGAEAHLLLEAPRIEAEPEAVTRPPLEQQTPATRAPAKPSQMDRPRPVEQPIAVPISANGPAESNPYDDPNLLVTTTQAPTIVRVSTSPNARAAIREKLAANPTPVDVERLFRGWTSRVHHAVRRVAGQSYSREARRRGSEGTVVLSMVVDPEGQVKMVRVARSSGHRELDQAAVAAVQSLGSVPAPPREAHAMLRPLTVPIAYRLQ